MSRRFYPPTESDLPMHGWRPYVEEVGEVARVLCEQRHGTYDDIDSKAMAALRGELVQTAAMTVAWIDAIDLEGR
jgi:hypothetical protein